MVDQREFLISFRFLKPVTVAFQEYLQELIPGFVQDFQPRIPSGYQDSFINSTRNSFRDFSRNFTELLRKSSGNSTTNPFKFLHKYLLGIPLEITLKITELFLPIFHKRFSSPSNKNNSSHSSRKFSRDYISFLSWSFFGNYSTDSCRRYFSISSGDSSKYSVRIAYSNSSQDLPEFPIWIFPKK